MSRKFVSILRGLWYSRKGGYFQARYIVHYERFVIPLLRAWAHIPLARLQAGPVPLRRGIFHLVTLLLRQYHKRNEIPHAPKVRIDTEGTSVLP